MESTVEKFWLCTNPACRCGRKPAGLGVAFAETRACNVCGGMERVMLVHRSIQLVHKPFAAAFAKAWKK